MIKRNAVNVINSFAGGQDTRTPILYMPLTKSPNMRNWHCAGIANRLMKRGGFAKVNSSNVESDGLDVFYPSGYQTTDYALRDAAARTQIAQGFKSNTTGTVTKVRLWLKKAAVPAATDTVTLTIQTDSAGVPSTVAVTNGVATAVDISDTITTSYAWVTFTFSTPPTLTAGTQYHLVLSGAFTVSGTNYILWGADNYDVIYPDGSMSVYDTTTWVSEPLYDACFEVYITGGSKGDDGVALFDFSSKNMFLGVFGTSLYKMDKTVAGTPDGTWDNIGAGGSTFDTYTKFLSHLDGSDAATSATDEIGKTISFVGDAQLDTAQKKFGTAALLCDGTGDYITLADSDDFNFGADSFTLDFQVMINSFSATNGIFGQAQDVNNNSFLYIGTDKNVYFGFNVSGVLSLLFNTTDAPIASTGQFYHLEVVRDMNTWYIFVDGVSRTLTLNSGSYSATYGDYTGLVRIGSEGSNNYFLNGWIDEPRISKGIARNIANFTPPSAAYSPATGPLTSSRFWTFGDWQSGRALINTDVGLYTYVGSGAASLVSGAPVSKFIIIWKNYVLAFGLRGSPNGYRYSNLSDYTTWDSANSFANAFNTNDGDVITGVRLLKGKLYVFKRYSVHRVTYLGSNPTFQIDQILGVGCPSHYTIKEIDFGGDIGTVLIFLTTDRKLAIFDGYNIQIINDSLSEETNDLFGAADDQPLSFADMNYTYTDLFHSVVKTDTSEYVLYCVLGTDTKVNYAFVFDYKTSGIYPYDGQIFSSSMFAISTSKARKTYCAGYTGYMWEMESGNSDDGSAINAYVVTAKIKPENSNLMNRLLQMGLHMKEVSSVSTLNLNVQYRLDWNTSWSVAEQINYDRNDDLAFGKTPLFDIGTIENMIQFKLKENSTNPAPTIYGMDMYGEALGVSVGDRATA